MQNIHRLKAKLEKVEIRRLVLGDKPDWAVGENCDKITVNGIDSHKPLFGVEKNGQMVAHVDPDTVDAIGYKNEDGRHGMRCDVDVTVRESSE